MIGVGGGVAAVTVGGGDDGVATALAPAVAEGVG